MSTRRRRTMVGLVCVAVVIVVALALIPGILKDQAPTSAFDGSVPRTTQTPPAPDATTTPDPSISATQKADVEEATSSLLGQVLPEAAEIDSNSPDDIVGDLSAVASRGYLSELESERLEFEAEGWSREGSYTVGEIQVLAYSKDGKSATVRACIDSSDLVVRREDGQVIENDSAPSRAWNIFILERTEGSTWRIAGRTFPENPAC